MKKESICIIGCGKVGTAVAFLLNRAGYPVSSLMDLNPEARKRAYSLIGAPSYDNASAAAAAAEIVFITTNDDSIENVCNEIASRGALNGNKLVIHTSGAGGLSLFAAAKKCGASIACIHPIQSFTTIEGIIDTLPGSFFGITAAEETAKSKALALVKALGGKPIFVDDRYKPLYHAAACIASNYLVALLDASSDLYQSIGLSEDDALRCLLPLVDGTLANIRKRGLRHSLTGPIARGDIGTIEGHAEALRNISPSFMDLYRILGAIALKIAQSNKFITPEQAEHINKILE
ncbi:MAG: DUF2520 domain-containing protein [Deltaproteobacteria bacterium]|nr:DUF2520 domain-containing protein [Deltaproteobacteria bacterium]